MEPVKELTGELLFAALSDDGIAFTATKKDAMETDRPGAIGDEAVVTKFLPKVSSAAGADEVDGAVVD